MRKDYQKRRDDISLKLGVPIDDWARSKYETDLWSCDQMAEHLGSLGFVISPRSILRWLRDLEVPVRSDSFYRNAMKTGRMRWALKDPALKSKVKQVQGGLRFMILERDGYKCVLCGATKETTVLEVEHVVAKANGGTNDPSNLRVLCHECNCGKRAYKKER